MKYIALVLAALVLGAGSAYAGTKLSAKLPRAQVVGVVVVNESDEPITKLTDGSATCYVFRSSISCVK